MGVDWFCRSTEEISLAMAESGQLDKHSEVMSERATNGKWVSPMKIKELRAIIEARLRQKIDPQPSSSSTVGDFTPHDRSQNFDFKGDYLGMQLDLFRNRHGGDLTTSLLFSNETGPSNYAELMFEPWMAQAGIINCRMSGKGMTIAGAPLLKSVYQFLDNQLYSINLEIAAEDSVEVQSALLIAFDCEQDINVIDMMQVDSWEKPKGLVSMVSYIDDSEATSIRFINKDLLDQYRSLERKFHPTIGDL